MPTRRDDYLVAAVVLARRPLRKSLRPGAATPYICRYFRKSNDDSGGTTPYSVCHSPMIVVKFRLSALTFRRPCRSLSASPAPGNLATIRGAAVATLELKPPDESWIMSSSSSRGFSETSQGRNARPSTYAMIREG